MWVAQPTDIGGLANGAEVVMHCSPPPLTYACRSVTFRTAACYEEWLCLAASVRSERGQRNRRGAVTAARPSRNRIARRGWGASSWVVVSQGGGRFESGSKLHALQTLRVAVRPQKPSQLENNLNFRSAERGRGRPNHPPFSDSSSGGCEWPTSASIAS